MEVSHTTSDPAQSGADTVAVGVFDGAGAPEGCPGAVAELLDSGEARSERGALAVTHVDGTRWLLVGMGAAAQLTPERARAAAAWAAERAREISTRTLCWTLPDCAEPEAVAGALVEGTALRDYRFSLHTSPGATPDGAPAAIGALIVSGEARVAGAVAEGAVVAAAANRARDLQNRPGNDLTPSALGAYALALAERSTGISATVEGREQIEALGMGAFSAVARGSGEDPALITLTYEGRQSHEAPRPTLGFVGKAVTFDSGGISLKPGARMSEMKFDMSGGAAVIEAIAAIAELRLPVRIVGVVGASENLPDGRAVKPGDVVTAANGRTIEINNTDAEGRLVLADCLWHACERGAEQIVDLATLTGAVIVALGSTHAGLISNDDALAQRLLEAGRRTGEILWRLPLHEEYDELVKGRYADLDNAPEGRKAGTIVGGAFLSHFVSGTPWAHLDIAGSAWDLERAYASKGASGYGVRLLVELARSYCL
jgi:leucyl aminopeptidase